MKFFTNPFDYEEREKRRKELEKYKNLQMQGKLTKKEFWALCKAQYAILFPVVIGINIFFFLVILAILKLWWKV